MRRKGLATVGLAAAVGAMLLVATPAGATPGAPGPTPGIGIDTDITMTGTAEGRSVRGSLPIAALVSDPDVAYPGAPPAGFAMANQDFAGIITAEGTETGTTLRLFCIDIRTVTYPGIGYTNGSWEQAGMPNVGYVARLLNDYYPNTNEPAGAPDVDVRAAAVQAAIWYFTDYFVLASNDPVRPYAAAIVNAIRVLPPLPFPTPPPLTVTPSDDSSPVGTPAGPFTVTTAAAQGAEVFSTDGEMFGDAAGTTPIAQGTAVANGQEVWLVPDDPLPDAIVTLLARGESRVPSGNVYIYDQNTPGVTDAQRLILAETVEVVTNVVATADFVQIPLAAFVVTKTIAGPAAGTQGAISVTVSCDDGTAESLDLPPGATGTHPLVIADLPIGTTCTVAEPVDGAVGAMSVTTTGLGSTSITADGASIAVANVYDPALAPSGGSVPLFVVAGSAVLILAGATMAALARRRALRA